MSTLHELNLAVRNATTLWTALGDARGREVLSRPGYLAVDSSERNGTRILVLVPDPGPDTLAELTDLVRQRRVRGKVLVEDSYSTVDMSALGLTPRQLPVMIRESGHSLPPPAHNVTEVDSVEQLQLAEHIIVHGFPVEDFQPYQPGEFLPKGILDNDSTENSMEFYLIARDGTAAGSCVVVTDATACGLYWVTTLPEHRSHGLGRALMHGVLRQLPQLPITLTAARAGKPLYDSLGFRTLNQATWWV